MLRAELTNGEIVTDASIAHAPVDNFEVYAENGRIIFNALNATTVAVGVHRGSLEATVLQPELVHVNVAQGPVNLTVASYGPKQPTVRAESTNGPVSVTMGPGFSGWFVASAYQAVAAVRSAVGKRLNLHTIAQELKTGWIKSSSGEGRIEVDSMSGGVGISFA
ncbi:hypothetical protein THASP1DRAFT_30210 [Thamnocephalis sphaerospora]|uniref:Adhesin domain-containing protein n=1 Tax=Thamnocephalis sphaerospora TaxID=78915 RepID=A0A4P9XR34_9FUNG|nr:hypothetical protein THASP1DRAFT_30210 [Thamnocephalis sphaerospora]|eukprot:RKP07971.1 hypothetical protein THASP1DRAFT_30210 [Thamnocephalis sphaerospora]